MFKSAQSVVYNFRDQKDVNYSSGLHITTPLPQFNTDLIEFIRQNCDDHSPIIIINAASQLPPYWQQRLIQPLLDDDSILIASALTTELYALSPLADKQIYQGDLMQLDNQVYQIQHPGYFVSNDINPDCFVVRNKHCLSAIGHQTYAVNNLVVQPKRRKPLRLREKLKLGDQKLLPAHPLAHLQIKLEEENNVFEINYPLLDDRPCLLHICMDWGGGVAKWINDFAATHFEYHHFVLSSCGELYRYTHGEKYSLRYGSASGLLLDQYDLTAPIKATTDKHPEYQAMLASIINQKQIQAVFVSTLIGHSMQCLNTGLPTFRILHDYFPHWPSLNAKLDKKTISDKDLSLALLDSCDEPFSCIEPAQFQSWQSTLATLLKDEAVRLIAPSHSVKNNLLKLKNTDYFTKTQIIPHAIKPIKAISYQPQTETFKILVLGRIGVAKGQVLLEQCVKLLGKNKAIKFIFLGAGNEGKKYLPRKNIKVIMDYRQEDLASLLADLSPQLALITSITSESFSYTLTELQSAGIPVVSTRAGALQERIEEGQTGFLSAHTAEDICALILSLKTDPAQLLRVHDNLKQLKHVSTRHINQRNQNLLTQIPFKPPEYKLPQTLIKPSQLAQKVQILSNNKQDLETLLNLSEEKLAKRTSWAQELGEHNQHLEKNLKLGQDESKHLKTVIKQKDWDFKKESKHLKNVIKTVQEAEHQTQVKLETLKNELDSVYESSSWKITQPLRNFTLWYRDKKNQLGFRFRQLKTSPKRLIASLKSRGVSGSLKAVKTKLSKPKPKKPVATVVINKDYQPIKIKTSKNPTISIIIPVFNHFEHSYHCLKSLSELTDKTTFEVILIDDCSTDETRQKIKLVKGIQYHRQAKNGG
ncbi:MAG: glycosyltransferase, partial [Proteobacteria bacterium]|nr:glycosyltransferase [Pseudomonadota bacterium]